MRLLLIDDDERVRKTFRIQLQKEGFELCVATNGQEGWEILQSDTFDLILCDIRMPKMNGIELLKRIRASDATLPVIMLSGFMESAIVEEAMAAGATDYLYKPVQKSDLLDKIYHHSTGRNERK